MRSQALCIFFYMLAGLCIAPGLQARTKMVALPQRSRTLVHLDNPKATLVQEERVLTLQKGLNQVDFSWKGVSIDESSIRLEILSGPAETRLLSVSYPPGESALVWDIHSQRPGEARVRISYLLGMIDRMVAYKGVVDQDEKFMQFKTFLVIRNFSGEDFHPARILFPAMRGISLSLANEETVREMVSTIPRLPVAKVWTWDSEKLPWDPEKQAQAVGIPVSYRFFNTKANDLGKGVLWAGKARIFLQDAKNSTVFLGEDQSGLVAVGEKAELYIGDSRDIAVTQKKMREKRINIRRNSAGRAVLWDTDELITAVIENFKKKPAILTMIQHIDGQWDMEKCNMKYRLKDHSRLVFEIPLGPGQTRKLSMHYHRRNIRP